MNRAGRLAGIAAGALAVVMCEACAARIVDAVDVYATGPDGGGGASGAEAGTSLDGGDASTQPPTSVWPNPASYTNSDSWIAIHHTQIAEMQPNVLVLDFANRFRDENGDLVDAGYDMNATLRPILQEHVDAFKAASAYLGYKDPSARPFLQYQLAYVIDLRDTSGAVNSALLPVSNGAVDYGALGSTAFADEMGIPDPDQPGTNLTLCGLFEKGIINEVWGVAADPPTAADGPTIKFAEVAETKQAYDADDHAIAGNLQCTSAQCIDQALACKVTTRLHDFNPGRGAGCHLYVNGLVWEGYLSNDVLPEFTRSAATFFNFDFEKRFGASFPSFYTACPPVAADAGACIDWPSSSHAVAGPASAYPFDFSPMSAGCGNAGFPPNAIGAGDLDDNLVVLTSCENYGLHNGPGGADMTTPYSGKTAPMDYASNPQVASADCSGPANTYLLASMPGLATTATDSSGNALKNWWVYLFY
ncbi:MAG TPA: hypothetical protein VK841_15830 [Polyangiaceae bacterium]|nr:hypothetical protein [Polyangiaceae bacterium]